MRILASSLCLIALIGCKTNDPLSQIAINSLNQGGFASGVSELVNDVTGNLIAATTGTISASGQSSSEPLAHNVYNDNLAATAGNRPFLILGCETAYSGLLDQQICRDSIARALVSRQFRIVTDPSGVSDYNQLLCKFENGRSFTTSESMPQVQLSALIQGQFRTSQSRKQYENFEVSSVCEVSDGLSKTLFYTGAGVDTVKRAASSSRAENGRRLLADGIFKSVAQALGRLGGNGRGVAPDVAFVEAVGFSDGNSGNPDFDYLQALNRAKINAVENSSTRIRSEASSVQEYSQSLSTGETYNATDSSKIRSLADAYVKGFDVIENSYLPDGRYFVKIRATVERAG